MNRKEERSVQKGERSPQGRKATDDQALVAAFVAGDRQALAELFRRYRRSVYEIAYRYTSNREDALEVTQEVFLKVIENASEFRRGARFSTWLYRIAVNQSIDYLRRRKRRSFAPLEGEGFQARGTRADPVLEAEKTELQERVNEALWKLSEKHRDVLVLHTLEHLSYAEIAKIVGCSVGTVMSRLFYARKRLAELLGEGGRREFGNSQAEDDKLQR